MKMITKITIIVMILSITTLAAYATPIIGNDITISGYFNGLINRTNIVGQVAIDDAQNASINSKFNSSNTTDNLTEGVSNLYFTNARARTAISAGANLTYDSGTGVMNDIRSNYPNSSLINYLLIATYAGNFPNQTVADNMANWNSSYNATYASDIAQLQTNDTTHDSNIASLQSNDTTHDSQISTLQTNDTTHDSQISSLQGNDTVHDSNIAQLQANDTTDRTYVNDTFLPISTYSGNFPNSTLASYNNNFPNSSLSNYLLISTYSGDFPNSSIPDLQANDTADRAYVNDTFLPILTYSGNFPNSTLAGYNGDFPNSSLGNYLLISTYSGNFPNQTVANNLANWNATYNATYDATTSTVNANLANWNSTYNATYDAKEPAISSSTASKFYGWDKTFKDLVAAYITDFVPAVRTNISSSSNLILYNSGTGVITDTINSSAQLSSSAQVTGLNESLNLKVNKSNIGEFTGGTLARERADTYTAYNNSVNTWTEQQNFTNISIANFTDANISGQPVILQLIVNGTPYYFKGYPVKE